MKYNEDQDEMKSYITILNDAKKELPNIVLPSMGIIDNEENVDINAKDYFMNKNNQEGE